MAFSILYWANFVAGTNKLQRKSEIAVNSNHVLNFTFDPVMKFASSKVQASMKDKSYSVSISLGDNYTIHESQCQCPNGLDKCHHKASVLLYGYKNVSKTSIRQTWVKNPKSVPPKVTQTMEELFPAPGKLREYRATNREVDDTDIKFFYDKLGNLGRFSAMHWILSPEPEKPTLCVPLVEDLLGSEEFMQTTENKLTWLRMKLLTSDEKIHQIAALTVGQKDNCLWALVRKYRVTASVFGTVLAAINRNRFPPSLYKRLSNAYNLDKKDSIIWGVVNESVAIQKYCSLGDAVVEKTGVWLHGSGVLGASPDGMIRVPAAYGFNHQNVHFTSALSNHLIPEVLEVKCPFSARDMTIQEAVEKLPGFCLELKDEDHEGQCYRLKENHDYFHQIQGQLYLTNKLVSDLMIWTRKDFAIVRIVRDTCWQTNISKLIDFYFQKYIPYLQNI